MSVFQHQCFMSDREGTWGDDGHYGQGPEFGAQFTDGDVNVQGSQYAPPPFGWNDLAYGCITVVPHDIS